jgi:hypothetical protein
LTLEQNDLTLESNDLVSRAPETIPRGRDSVSRKAETVSRRRDSPPSSRNLEMDIGQNAGRSDHLRRAGRGGNAVQVFVTCKGNKVGEGN